MRFSILDRTGHSVVDFDKLNPADLKKAAEMFAELVRERGMTAGVRTAGGQSKLTRSFDPNADETVFFDHLSGG